MLPFLTCLSLCSFVSGALDLSTIAAAQLERQVRIAFTQCTQHVLIAATGSQHLLQRSLLLTHRNDLGPGRGSLVDRVSSRVWSNVKVVKCPCADAAPQIKGARRLLRDPGSQRHAPRLHAAGCGSQAVRLVHMVCVQLHGSQAEPLHIALPLRTCEHTAHLVPRAHRVYRSG